MSQISFLTLILLIFPLSTQANAVVKEIRNLVLISANGTLTIPYDSLQPKTSLALVSPHITLNPKKERHLWTGVTLKSLFEKHAISVKPNDTVVMVGSNEYLVETPAKPLIEHKVIVAVQRDGRAIPYYKGGPQIMFPLQDKQLPHTYHVASWWCWYLSAVFIGEIAPILELQGRSPSSLDLQSLPHLKTVTEPPPSPPGQRTSTEKFLPLTQSRITLDKLLGYLNVKAHRVIVTTYLGKKLKISNPEEFHLNFLWEGKFIPPTYGGPIQLCRTDSPKKCTYFVKTLGWELDVPAS